MILLILQLVQDGGGGGFRVDTGVLVTFFGSVMTVLLGTIGTLWLQSVAEGKRKDQLIDKLIDQIQPLASTTDRALTHAERERGVRR